jgi:hypothetical protein
MGVSASEEARSVHGLDFVFNQSPYSVPIIGVFTDLPLYPSTVVAKVFHSDTPLKN